ncbi:MAG: alpha-glucosidase/alpha-galactosidase [Lentisphaerae bacterium RIFOXYB12_FULL_65_16]|nr:MAG: alpha-glucosidase/alpha-galactosidase [Lentisphaerae bacterium RIFOXYA12_64_32]OGV86573.1 MAG: alpha-glucosidase/alpha-galactosidase [Lentisphaerae bacterium RIFOXYB12_FULL_65_16]
MAKITFTGAGSTVFAKNVLGDSMLTPTLHDAHIALYDIDPQRLQESKMMMDNLNANINQGRARITGHAGVENRRDALRGADFVVNAIQVGGYEPSTVIDFEVPKKYGLRQTIADTLGIGGIFRALRTIPVLADFARDIEDVCPNAWFLNYVNPMSALSGYMQRHTGVNTVGLCHSVQGCASGLLRGVGLGEKVAGAKWKCAGINHMCWLLELKDKDGKDLYPEVKQRALAKNDEARQPGGKKHWDMVRYEILRNFGYYNSESSEHTAEYHPYFINSRHPELVEELNIPLDEYPRRCIHQIQQWQKQRDDLVHDKNLTHQRTHEYASHIMEAILTDQPFEIGGNVLNRGLIPNLPADACVEVPCLVNRNGVQGCYVGPLPEQLAALNRTHINVHLLTIEAAVTHRKDKIYQAAMMDPHTRAELTLDQIRAMCDDLIAAHGSMMPTFE